MKIADMVNGTTITGAFLVENASILKTTGGKPYVALDLFDGERAIKAKIWNYLKPTAPTGVIDITAQVSIWADQLQLTISDWKESSVPLTEFEHWSPYDIPDMTSRLYALKSMIVNEDLRTLVGNILSDYETTFHIQPAAKSVHHNYKGGLLEHTLHTCETAVAIAKTVPESVSLDLVIAGALLHDIGKMRCYDISSGVSKATIYDFATGHIVEGIKIIEDAVQYAAIDAELLLMLEHIVASHHENLEWGSPVTPKTTEAYIVAFADNLNAKTTIIRDLAPDRNNVGMTEKSYFLSNYPMFTRDFVTNCLKED